MFTPTKITEDIYHIGVNDRTKELFESLWPLPNGITYNSYLINDDKIVVFDTVDVCYSNVFFRKIENIIGDKPVDYLVINHMEPDHSGSIELFKTKYPNVKIIGNKLTAGMLEGFFGITDNIITVKDGEELELGSHKLKFVFAPMVHWPEVMFSYDTTTNTIFSADAFGTYGAMNGSALDTEINPDIYWDEMIRYYSNIVGKYGKPVQRALAKVQKLDLKIDNICSTHGPVWTQKELVSKVIGIYDKLSKYESDKGLVIAYGSMYGNVEFCAEIIAEEAAKNGIKNIRMHNVSKSHESDILKDIFKYKGLIIGSPTYNGEVYPKVESLLEAIKNREIIDRYFGVFGGYTWASTAVKKIVDFGEEMNFEMIGNPVDFKQAVHDDAAQAAMALGRAMAERLNADDEAH